MTVSVRQVSLSTHLKLTKWLFCEQITRKHVTAASNLNVFKKIQKSFSTN